MELRKRASSLAQFIKWAEEVADAFTEGGEYASPWFRGVTSSTHKLVPSLYRSDAGRETFQDDELRNEFKRRGLPLVAERPPRDDWEWYFLMQHYGAPTRLLDWTDSALVALYFATSSLRLSEQPSAKHRPAVWALNPWKLNGKRFIGPQKPGLNDVNRYLPGLYRGEKLPQYPVALDPTFIAQRMLVQHSHFTLHGYDFRGLEEQADELNLSDGLFQIVIQTSSEDIRLMRKRLALMGICETTIFPDPRRASKRNQSGIRHLLVDPGVARQAPN